MSRSEASAGSSAGTSTSAGARERGGRASQATSAARIRTVIDCLAVAALLAVGVIGFGSVFRGADHLVAGGGGVLLGIAIAVVGARLRAGVLPIAAATVVVYLVFGGALAMRETTLFGVVPTIDTLRELLLGVVTSWKRLLTAPTPVDSFAAVLVVPYLSALVTSVVAASAALRTRGGSAQFAPWSLLPPAILLVASISFGTTSPVQPVAQGVAFALVAAAWLSWRRVVDAADRSVSAPRSGADRSDAGVRRRRIATAAGMLAFALVAGVAVSAFAPPSAERRVLREAIEPPLDLRDYASPLTSFRSYVRDNGTDALFTVEGLPQGARIRLATLDAFDGIVYNVSGDGSAGSGRFTRVEGSTEPVSDEVASGGTEATIRVTIGDLGGVWLPDVGSLERVTFSGDREDDLGDSLHYNRETGVGIVTAGLRSGDVYTLDAVVPRVLADEQIQSSLPANISMPADSGVPDSVAAAAAESIAEAETPLAQLRAIESTLSTEGFFSHGLEGEAVSRAGHSAGRLQTLLTADQMVGDDEQYAVAMALMARDLGMPARVVMGFYPDAGTAAADASSTEAVEMTGKQLHAWVEVAFDGAGWVTFDPTPPENQVPQEQTPKPKSKPRAQVLQPPPPPQEPVELPPDSLPDDLENEQDPLVDDSLLAILAWVGGSLALVLVLVGPAAAIALAKLRRRRRRERAPLTADRVSGGWNEYVDRAVDLGAAMPLGSTRREDAAALESIRPHSGAVALAARADDAVFGAGDPTEAEAVAYWRDVQTAVAALGSDASWWTRARARFSMASLRRGRRARADKPGGPARPARRKTMTDRGRTNDDGAL